MATGATTGTIGAIAIAVTTIAAATTIAEMIDRWDDRRWDDDRRGRGHGYAYGHDKRHYYPAPRWNGPGLSHRLLLRPPPRWVRGGRIYGPGYGPTYVVTDYRGYGLRYPPHGYGWRRDDHGHFLLVALATGVIADLIYHGGH